MALPKQPITINFSQGVQTKVDPFQLPVGNFLALKNSVFDVEGRLTKRNGYPLLTTLPNTDQTTATTFNNNLLATGSNLYALSQATNSWVNKGSVQPVDLSVQSLVRVSTSQTAPDAAVTALGLTCLVYVDTSLAYYQISDATTGQQVLARVALPSTATNPRVFLLNRYFVITFMATVSAATHLQYIAIPIVSPTSPTVATDVSASVSALTAGYDGVVANDTLYLGWAGASTTVKLAYITSTLGVSSTVTISTHTSTLMSMTADTSGSTAKIYCSFWDSGSNNGYTAVFNQILGVILASTQIISSVVINEITSVATAGVCTVIYENQNTYSFSPNAKTDYLSKLTITQAGVVVGPSVVLRSVGLASKAFIAPSGVIYTLAAYGETNQPTYFLIDSLGNIYMRLAGENGGGYASSQVLPTVSVMDDEYLVPYLIKDFLATVNNGTNLPAGTPVNAIYTQTGINLARFSINTFGQNSSEIAGVLNLTGGQVWMYDGVKPVEQNFHVWPENIMSSTSSTSGSMSAQTYFYVFTYEWTDNQGNLHRSAPSIPQKQVQAGGSSAVDLHIPTLRLTYKVTPNPVRIVGYRWSTAQQTYYQFTSITSPIVNDTSVDSVNYLDTASDASILGQTLLYTTGGVVENIAPPACVDSTLFKNRVFIIDAEDRNSVWYSKPVLKNTPVEFSDLQTIYVSPTIGSEGSTGPITAVSTMDDKLIIFKSSAIYYETGLGPDITGANNDFNDPVYVQTSAGTDNPDSIVLTPDGLMFQSATKGIWLLNRGLQVTYIGAPVEAYNSQVVKSSEVIPGTNQVRFILDNGITLVYDYYYKQWGTFSNLSAISACIYNQKHTYLNSAGQIYQETPNTYLDGTSPVLLSFTTSWITLAGIQGFERFYFANLLGTYYTPFKLNISIGFDYNASAVQNIIVTPDNYSPEYGDEAVWGSGAAWGGPGNVFSSRIFPNKQKCESFQLTIEELYDPSFGQAPGAGLSLSGLNLIAGMKRGFRTQSARKSFG